MKQITQFAKTDASAWIHLCTQQENKSAQALYKKSKYQDDPFKYNIYYFDT